MTYERKLDNNIESVDDLTKRPVDELAIFIAGDSDIFHTLMAEVEQLSISEQDRSERLKNIAEAGMISGVSFQKVEEIIKE